MKGGPLDKVIKGRPQEGDCKIIITNAHKACWVSSAIVSALDVLTQFLEKLMSKCYPFSSFYTLGS